MRTSPFFVPRTRDGAQPSIRSITKRKEKQEANKVGEVVEFPIPALDKLFPSDFLAKN
jgi:hypothetical protein